MHSSAAPFQLQEAGTLIACEAAQIHQALFASGKDAQLDGLVKARITRGQTISACALRRCPASTRAAAKSV